MPTYDYKCPSCHKIETMQHRMDECILPICIECFQKGVDHQMKKQFGGCTGLHFKGSGFYETDYKAKGK